MRRKYGIDGVSEPKLNWKNLLARKDDVIMRHTKGLDFLMKKNKITTFRGVWAADRAGGRRRAFQSM